MPASIHPPALALLNAYQRDFPLEPEPFAEISARQGKSAGEVLECFRRAQESGLLSRIGPVFAPGRAGASTLAALAVPPQDLERVAEIVSAYPEVNHNYAREHRYNLWFVVTAAEAAALARVLDELRRQTGLPLLDLPMIEGYHIDLGFDLAEAGVKRRLVVDGVPGRPDPLDTPARALLGALQAGLPLVPRPFELIAARLGSTEQAVLAQLRAWLANGLIKRFGVVVRHHELGFAANAMVVWNVADGEAGERGRALATLPWVTLCYRRPRRLPDWPYNLFSMIHGRDRATVLAQVEEAAQSCGLAANERAVLFSTRRFKQRGAYYQVAEAGHA